MILDFLTPKGHILGWDRVVWAIARENPSSGLTCRWVSEKKGINKINFGYISRICQEAPRGRICTKFGTGGRLPDVINCAIFFGNRFRDLHSVGGSNFALVHWLGLSPLIQCCATAHLWCTCDSILHIYSDKTAESFVIRSGINVLLPVSTVTLPAANQSTVVFVSVDCVSYQENYNCLTAC